MEFDFLLLLAGILFFASLIHGSIGFGFPMIATPLLALVTDLQTAILYTLIPTLLVNIVSIASEGNFFAALKRFYPLAIFAMLGTAVGTQILLNSDSDQFKLLLAVAILFYLLLDFIKINIPWIRNCPTCSMRAFGLLAGVLAGLTNAMAPVLIIYTLESRFSKAEIIQASNICFFFGKVVQLILFSFAGVFSVEVMGDSSIALLAIAVALFIGVKIKGHINANAYKRIIKLVLLLISLMLIFQTL